MAVQDLLYRRHVTFNDILDLNGHKSEETKNQMNASSASHAGRLWEEEVRSAAGDTNNKTVACQ